MLARDAAHLFVVLLTTPPHCYSKAYLLPNHRLAMINDILRTRVLVRIGRQKNRHEQGNEGARLRIRDLGAFAFKLAVSGGVFGGKATLCSSCVLVIVVALHVK